jgi:hypothetical protein
VFLDASGQRWRRLRLTSLLLLTPLLIAGATTLGLASTRSGADVPRPSLTVADTGRTLPVIGSGPLVRVLQVGRGRAAARTLSTRHRSLGPRAVRERPQ